MSTDTTLVRVPVRLRTVVHDEGADDVRPSVRCPRQERSIDALRCLGCTSMRTIEWDPKTGGSITCDHQTGEETGAACADPRADLAERAARARVQDVMAPVITCVGPETSVRRVRSLLLARNLHAVPVVDHALALIGIVSRSDLVSLRLDHRVDAIMPSRIHALPEDAPLSYAIALMAFERIHEVPIVTEQGEVVGMITANDVLRWTAKQLGYVDEIGGDRR